MALFLLGEDSKRELPILPAAVETSRTVRAPSHLQVWSFPPGALDPRPSLACQRSKSGVTLA